MTNLETGEIIDLISHLYETDIDNCIMSHSQWVIEVANALTDKKYLSNLVIEYKVYLEERGLEFNFKHI